MKEKDFFWERLNLPGEAIPGKPLVEIAGDSRVLIEGHRGVREYSRERICVKVSYGQVLVCGSCLQLRCMSKERLVICGRIESVTLGRKGMP